MNKYDTKISKFLSLVLRHRPEAIGISLDKHGWTEVSPLLNQMKTRFPHINRAALDRVVRENNKQRFAFSENGLKIRANQGHSKPIDLQLEPQTPPPTLYHGTARKNLGSIYKQGIQPGNRHHVHLSDHVQLAQKVGSRHGLPVVLAVSASKMEADGFAFFLSENGVWLTDAVPPQYLSEHT